MRERNFIPTSKLREALEKGYDIKLTYKGIDIIIQSKVNTKSSYHAQEGVGNQVFIRVKTNDKKDKYLDQYALDINSEEYKTWFFKHIDLTHEELFEWRYLLGIGQPVSKDTLWQYYDYPMKPNLLYQDMQWLEGENGFLFIDPLKSENTVMAACTKKLVTRVRPHKHRRSSWKHHPISIPIGRSAIKKVLVSKHDTSIAVRKEMRLAEKAAKVLPTPTPPSERYSIKSPFRSVRRGSKVKGVRKDPYLKMQLIDATTHKYELRPTVSKKGSRRVRINLLEEETFSYNSLVPVFSYVPRLFKSKKHPEWNETEPTERTHWVPVLETILKEPIKVTRLKKPTHKVIYTLQYPQSVIDAGKSTKKANTKLPDNAHMIMSMPKGGYIETDDGVLWKRTNIVYKKENFFVMDKTTTT